MYGSNKRKPVIALDYDGTISLTPNFFKDMIEKWKHAIDFYIVTYRDTNAYTAELREFEELSGHDVIFTNRKAKIDFLEPDIWIDDMPMSVNHDYSANGTYELCESMKEDAYKKVCRYNSELGVTSCHNELSKVDKDRFSFCPYCGATMS